MASKNFKISSFETKTLIWWINRRDKIDMEPSYQRRGKLWSATDKAYLIDSIINGYDVPKIYIADFTWGNSPLNSKRLPYAIIDGKQRFEAIFDFFNGNIVLNDDFIYLENPSLKLAGLGYKDLLKYPEVIEEFQNFNLMVMSVYAKNDAPISELFVRLNRSKALTGAEIRNAMAGPAPVLIRQIEKHEFFTTNIRFEVKRGQAQNASAKLLLFEYYKDFKDTKKIDLDDFVGLVRSKNRDRLELAGRYVFENLNSISSIFLPKDALLNSAGIIPVYYWLVRESNERHHSRLREFINAFEIARKRNRQLIRAKSNVAEIKTILIEYDNYNRSTNNEQSHRERFRILKSSFVSFIKTGSF